MDYEELEREDLEFIIETESPKQPLKEQERPAASRKRQKEVTSDHLERLLAFDREHLCAPRPQPAQVVIGTDEVGRGCLAGPVMAAAVILPTIDPLSELGMKLYRLNDSKQVNPLVRAELAEILRGMCQFAIAEASVEEIDEINILQASLLAMKRAIRKLKVSAPAVILVDGNKAIGKIKNIEQVTVIDGDTKSASIAAASIIAKVHRDAFMTKLASKFPHYRWESNKGYRSKDHWAAITEHGMCDWHRRTFVHHWLEEDS
jgi:ribonuclease HII